MPAWMSRRSFLTRTLVRTSRWRGMIAGAGRGRGLALPGQTRHDLELVLQATTAPSSWPIRILLFTVGTS